MNILDTIIAKKKIEVEESKKLKSVTSLEQSFLFKSEVRSFTDFLLSPDKTGIIAEFKRASPSKGIINDISTVAQVTGDYTRLGASALSVLTDSDFFGGSMKDLSDARLNDIPLLRKEFIVDEYQLIESKSYGADIILLIAACLSVEEVKNLAFIAKNLGLNVLLEIHNEQELGHICDRIDVVGINNRDLKTFKVDIAHSIELGKKIPSGILKISESGIDDVDTIHLLKKNDFKGFLIGENFMKTKDPGKAFENFVNSLQMIDNNNL